MLRLPYSFETSQGKLSFSIGERMRSVIDENVTVDKLQAHLTRVFNSCGDMTNDVTVDGMKVSWTMRYGKLSPRRCFCILENVEPGAGYEVPA